MLIAGSLRCRQIDFYGSVDFSNLIMKVATNNFICIHWRVLDAILMQNYIHILGTFQPTTKNMFFFLLFVKIHAIRQ